MSRNQGVIIKAIAVLAVVWIAVIAVRSFAAGKRVTAERMDREVRMLTKEFDDWSEGAGSSAEAARREKEIRRIADMYVRLDFHERQKDRESHSGDAFFKKLTDKEKGLFLDLTVMETMGRFMEAIDQMPKEERRGFVEKGLKEIQEGRTEEEMKRAEEMDGKLLTKISEEGMRAYFDKASADTKLDLAPLMEAMNEIMQGLRAREFGRK